MPPARTVFLLAMLAVLEVIAGFMLVVGSSLIDLTTLGYATFWLFLLGALGGLVTGRAVSRAGIPSPWNRIALLAGAVLWCLVPMLLLVHGGFAPYTGAILVAIFYWRGLSVAREDADFEDVPGRLAIGFGVLLLGMLWVVARGIMENRGVWTLLAVAGIGYTVIGMIALGVARLERMREPGAGLAVMLAIAVQLLAIVVLAFLALQLFAIDLAGALWSVIHPVFDTLGAALFRLASLLAGPIDHLISLIRPTHAHPSHPQAPVLPGQEGGPTKKHKPLKPGNDLPLVIAGIIFLLLLASGLATLIWRLIPDIPARVRQTGFTEQRISLWSPALLWHTLLAWFRGLFRDSVQVAERMTTRVRHRLPGNDPADSIRRAYVQVLRRASRTRFARQPAETPSEYATRLRTRLPAVADNIAALTAAYNRRRYGELVLDPGAVLAVQSDAAAIRTALSQAIAPPAGDTAATAAAEGEEAASAGWLAQRLHHAGAVLPALLHNQNVVRVVSVAGPVLVLIGGVLLLNFLTGH